MHESPDTDFSHDEYVAPQLDGGGVYVLDRPETAARGGRLPGNAAPWAAAEAHPRVSAAGRRYPGPMGAGRREGYARPPWRRRGGERHARRALDNVMWDPRPPHFNPQAGGEHAHLALMPGFRGKARVDPGITRSQAMTAVEETFAGAAGETPGGSLELGLQVVKVVLFLIMVVLLVMWMLLSAAQSRISANMRLMLAEALAAGHDRGRDQRRDAEPQP